MESKGNIRFMVMDVDGTLTDGKIYMSANGELFKAFDIKDGCGIKDILPTHGIVPVIITGRKSRMLELRCEELGIRELYQGIREKLNKLEELLEEYSRQDGTEYTLANVAYIGDDILDLPCMLPVRAAGGITGCPADAVQSVLEASDFVSRKNGGDGAVREFVEWVVRRESNA